jgi:hypothetical protein
MILVFVFSIRTKVRAGGVAQVVEHLLSKCEAKFIPQYQCPPPKKEEPKQFSIRWKFLSFQS